MVKINVYLGEIRQLTVSLKEAGLDPNLIQDIEGVCISSFKQGYEAALWQYAWWKDGTEYVGCGRKTFREALKDIDG
jgi:hypothetical protein